MLRCIFLFLIFCLVGCKPEPPPYTWQEIVGRDGIAIYQARVPTHWVCEVTSVESLKDTMKPLCTYVIRENGEEILISIHNFPSESLEQRIPPAAQIERWKKQFQTLDPGSIITLQQSHGGFSGYLFEGTGNYKEKKKMMLAWAMQIASDHYNYLSHPKDNEELTNFKQMRADYTIKALGSVTLMNKYKDEIKAFARSFELIQEIPSHS